MDIKLFGQEVEIQKRVLEANANPDTDVNMNPWRWLWQSPFEGGNMFSETLYDIQ